MQNTAARIQRLKPTMKAGLDFVVYVENGNERLADWNSAFGPIPTDAELLAVDLTQPTAEERDLERIKEIISKRDDLISAAEVKEAVLKFLRKRLN